ncbi:MAG TPA: class I SAM-dependent methyltransferase [Ktedonobacterales bacterium]|nr:class I SAM-dependent methyltransferase [Ktedonobacterales bacterium]
MRTTQADAGGAHVPQVDYPWFSRFFNWLAARGPGREAFAGLRRETAGRARGVVLELGAGGGSNFAFYDPTLVERVEATEPDATMLGFARAHAARSSVPVTLTQAPAEALPFANDTFDTAVMTLVFCSVADPQRSLSELLRVLKPGGRLLMAEHVRSEHAVFSTMQTALVPLTARVAANCHWNRDTASLVRQSGFTDVRAQPVAYPSAGIRLLAGGLLPILLIEARKP